MILTRLTRSFFPLFILTVFVSLFILSSSAFAADIEAVTDSADGSSAFSVKSSANVEQAHIDSIGNIVAKGCVRIDNGLVECSETEGLVVDGNVGIGTVNPLSKLQVAGGLVRIGLGGTLNNAAGAGDLYVQSNLEVDGTIYGDGSGLTALPSTLPAGGWVDGGTNIFQVTTTDNVGIGTTSPSTTFEIVKSANRSPLMISSAPGATGDFVLVTSSGNVGIGTVTPVGGLTVMKGNVGIGTWSPVGALEVRGVSATRIWTGAGTDTNANAAGELYVEGDLEVDGTIYGDGTGITALATTLPAAGWTDAGTSIYTTTTSDNVGIGLTTPTATLAVENASPGDSLRVNDAVGDTTPFIIGPGGNVGIGTSVAGSLLSVAGGAAIGSGPPYSATAAPVNGLMVEGNVGIGTTTPSGALAVIGGNVGIGTWNPVGILDVKGTTGTRIWTGAGTDTNATSGGELYVEGDLEVDGTIYGDGSGITALPTALPAGGWVDGGTNVYQTSTTDNIGIGTTSPNAATVEIVKNAAQSPLKVSSTAAGSGDFFKIDSGGNIGIGTTNTSLAAVSIMNGNVGIGTINPRAPFSVSANVPSVAGASAIYFYNSNSQTNNAVITTDTNASGSWALRALRNGTTVGGFMTSSGLLNIVSGTSDITFNTGFSGTTYQERMRILDSTGALGIGTTTPVGGVAIMNGNVGIGTWSPTASLEVKSGAAKVWTGAGTNTNATAPGEMYVEGDLEVDGTIYGDGSGITALPTALPAGGWTDGGTNIYQITTTDNVGIGTTTPNAATLEIVKNAAQAPLKISSTAAGAGDFLNVSSSGRVGIGTTLNGSGAGLSVMNGNVGIGTWNPGFPIHAIGKIFSSTSIQGGIAVVATSGSYAAFGSNSLSTPVSLTVNGDPNNGRGFVIDTAGNTGLGTATPVGGLVVMNGNVGIGTWSPTASLEVKSGAAKVWTGAGTNTNATAPGEMYVEGDLEVDGTIYGDGSGITALPTALPAGGWTDGGTNIYQITTTDNVGIGTTSPNAATLEIVKNAAQAPLRVSSSATGAGDFLTVGSSGRVGIGTTLNAAGAGFAVMNGNVGIGTWNPVRLLTLTGGDLQIDYQRGFYGLNSIGNAALLGSVTTGSLPGAANGVINVGVYAGGNTNGFQIGGNTGGIGGASNILSFVTSTTEQMRITSSGNVGIGTIIPVGGLTVMNGNVGIGTWSPTTSLEVKSGAVKVWTGAGVNTNATAPGEEYVEGDLEVDGTIYGDGSGITALPTTLAAGGWVDGGTNVYQTSTTDNVGLGTTSPSGTLEIVKSGTTTPLMVSSAPTGDGDYLMVATSGNIGIGTTANAGGLAVMNGNVGIGTWAPGSRLQVVGTVEATALVGNGAGIFGIISGGGWTDGGTNIFLSDTTDNVGIGTTTPAASTSLEIVRQGTNAPLKISGSPTGAGDFLNISSEGRVGIGTTLNASGAALSVMNGNVGIGTWSPGGGLIVLNGNVGIGSEGPAAKLSVFDLTSRPTAKDNNAAVFIRGAQATGQTTSIALGAAGTLPLTKITSLQSPGGSRLHFLTSNNYAAGINVETMAVDYTGGVAIGATYSSAANGFYGPANGLIVEGNTGIGTTRPVGALTVMNGNVGIGTWSPNSQMEIKGGNVSILSTGGTNTNATGAGELYVQGDLEVDGTIYGDGSGITALPTTLAAGGWIDGGTNVYQTSTTDNVGIGTTSPNAATLEIVKNAAQAPLKISSTSAGSGDFLKIDSSGNIGVGTIAPRGAFIVMNGNVGVGTTNPSRTLHVAGSAFVENSFFLGTTTSTGNLLSFNRPASGYNSIDFDNTNTQNFLRRNSASPFSMELAGSSGVDVVVDSNNNETTSALRVLSNGIGGTGTLLMNVQEDGNIGLGTSTPVGGTAVMNGNVGIGTWSPNSRFEVNGAMGTVIISKAGNYTATINDSVIVVDASAGAVTITLPPAAGVKGRIYHIKKTDASVNLLTIDGNGGETIDGAATIDTSTQYHSFTLVCDGSNWWII